MSSKKTDDELSYRSLNPATGVLDEEFPFAGDDEIDVALGRASDAFGDWRRRPLGDRLGVLEKAADLLEERSDALARRMAHEMGKPLVQGRGEAEKCAWVCRHYVEHAEEYLRPRAATSDGSEAWVRFEPIGPVLAVMPWNFPFWQVFRFAAPNLAAGNVGILKHAPSVPGCARTIESLLREAGLPEGVFQNLFLSREQTSRVIESDAVAGVTLTGSVGAGRAAAARAGGEIKPTVLELGGSDPFVVFEDADLHEAVKQGVTSRCLNSGQSCIAAKRFLVEAAVLDRFLDAFVDRMEEQTVGDPTDEDTDVGPLAREDLRDHLAEQVERAQKEGATAVCGGAPVVGDGFFYPPTVLTGLVPDADVAQEELFGPVAILHPFVGEKDALAIANGTDYGLGASLWTTDRERIQRLVPEIEAGSVFVNGLVKSDPRLPFGGVKDSGYGRELARDGMLELVNKKTVWIA